MTMITPSYLGETIEYSSLHACRSTLEDPTHDSVATFHLSNGARLERIYTFGNLRPYGLRDSYGVTVNYRYLPAELEENHERFVRGEIQVANGLASEYKAVRKAWEPRGALRSGKN